MGWEEEGYWRQKGRNVLRSIEVSALQFQISRSRFRYPELRCDTYLLKPSCVRLVRLGGGPLGTIGGATPSALVPTLANGPPGGGKLALLLALLVLLALLIPPGETGGGGMDVGGSCSMCCRCCCSVSSLLLLLPPPDKVVVPDDVEAPHEEDFETASA